MPQPILIVENDPHWHQMLSEVSEKLGYTTCQVGLARDALNLIRSTDIALILLDIKLPTIQGHLLLSYLRKNKIVIPVIVVAGYLSPEVVETLIDFEVHEIIIKSQFRVRRLADAIASAL